MKKNKSKNKKQLTHWLSVIVIGIALGLAIQFVKAWTEPTDAPPNGNVGAPINTGAGIQTKTGTASNKADICVDPVGDGNKKCLGDQITFPACTKAGGIPTTVGGTTICKFAGATCPSGWVQYLKYSETAVRVCTGAASCGTSVSSGSHSFGNIDPATETRTYLEGTEVAGSCCSGSCSTGKCSGPNGWIVDCGWTCCSYYSCPSCSTSIRNCDSIKMSTGCSPI